MRRVVGSLVLLPLLLLLLATPAAAAPPIRESSTQESLFAFAQTCGPSTCTDTFVDAFPVEEGLVVICMQQFTFNLHTGRLVSEEQGCSDPTSSAVLTVADDLSGGSIAPTAVTFLNCNPAGCQEGGTVVVSAELTAFGPVFSSTDRGTFTDGTCTFRFRSSQDSRQAEGTLTIDGETLAANGSVGVGEFTFSSQCKE